MRKPYWFAQKNCWYYKTKSGKAIRLDPDKDTAWQLWADQTAARARVVTVDTPLSDIAEEFLEEQVHLLTDARFKAVAKALASFLNHFGAERSWYDLDKKAVYQWLQFLKEKEGFKNGTRRNYGTVVKSFAIWAHREGRISSNSLAGLKLPSSDRRETQASIEVHSKVMVNLRNSENWNDRVMANVLALLKLTGARPSTIVELSAKEVARDGGSVFVRKHKTAEKTKKPMVVYLSPCARTLVRVLKEAAERKGVDRLLRLAGEEKRDKGRKRNQKPSSQEGGRPFTAHRVSDFFQRIRKTLDLPKDAILYSYRHSFATRGLTAGLDIATVARMLGHQSIQMVAQVYSHLDQEDLHMAAAAARVGQAEYLSGNQRAGEKKSSQGEGATNEKR